jgi:serine/threonine-protein kinase
MTDQFGPYTLLERLGSGDMGTTYRAQQDDQAPVALKILDHIDTSNVMKRDASMDILEFVQSLSHPRLHPIEAILNNPDGDGRVALVMPFAPMESLGKLMTQGKLPAPKLGFKLLGQVATAIQFLHSNEVAHGSIKPNNLLLDSEGNITLTDLSMAHLREMGFVPAQPTTQHLLFMPPEREYHAAPEMVGDVYSLAVLAYLLLSGQMPFTEPEPETRGIISQNGLPPAVLAVLRRAMNPHLRLRYPSLGEFMNALKDATQGKVDPQTEKVFGINAPPAPPTHD